MNGSAAPNLLALFALAAVIGVLPLATVVATAFAKINVVLLIVRNALGVQQTPPNLVVNGVTIILTAYVMAPVGRDTYAVLADPRARYETVADFERAFTEGVKPVKAFLRQYADPASRRFFKEAGDKVWGSRGAGYTEDDLVVLAPAFLTAELTRAFQIGFLLYIPFLMVDFAVSCVLIALGMSMLSPPQIATPLKLLLFVLIDGWTRLLEGLVLTYAP